jgi:hypothetical protein
MTGDVTINIPKIPVTSVNGMTGDVQIDIPEPTGSSFIVTLTVTSWTEQINAEGLFASLPACSHTFQEINEAYNADKTIIFDLIDSRDEDTHTYLPLTGKTKMNGETTYSFGVDFGGTFFNGYFSRYATRPTIFKKVYMDKITVDSASVGQTVVVKSVDYKGVPTAWEAVDLPSGSSSQPDWNQNDDTQPDYIKNRTHYDGLEDHIIEWDGSTDFREYCDIPGDRYYKISDYCPSEEEILAGTIEYSNGEVHNISQELFSGFANAQAKYDDYLYFIKGVIVSSGNTLTQGLDGTYARIVNDVYPVKFIYRSTIVHPLDERFIPDTIARVSDISHAIVSAGTVKVGQTIRVKHINVSGKIEWEAVDFPEADLSAYYTKAEIDSLLNGYIAEVDAIIG